MKSILLVLSFIAFLQARSAAVAFDITKGTDLQTFLLLDAKAGDKPFANHNDESNWLAGGVFFQGYLANYTSMLEMNVKLPYKIPVGVSVHQIVLIVAQFVGAHPEFLQYPSGDLISISLIQAFPNPEWKKTP